MDVATELQTAKGFCTFQTNRSRTFAFESLNKHGSKHTESHQAFKIAEGGALLTQLSDEGFENLKPDISLALALELAFWM